MVPGLVVDMWMAKQSRGLWFSVLSFATHAGGQMLKRMRQEDLGFKGIWDYTFCVEMYEA